MPPLLKVVVEKARREKGKMERTKGLLPVHNVVVLGKRSFAGCSSPNTMVDTNVVVRNKNVTTNIVMLKVLRKLKLYDPHASFKNCTLKV